MLIICIVPAAVSCFTGQGTKNSGGGFAEESTRPPRRFVCVYSGSSDYFKNNLKAGLEKASEDLDLWVKLYCFKPPETDKHCEELDKAIASKVDGIITNIPDSGAIHKYIDAAYSKNIPVILIESDLPGSRRISFIGTNSYTYGVNAGKLMLSASKGKANTAMFTDPGISRYSLKEQGFMDTIRDYPDMSVERFDVAEPSIIEYINTAQAVLIDNTHIDSFFCTDAESTLGVVRAMIEFNKTDKIVIGSGDSDEILKHVKNGMIYASLVEDPYSIGYLSAECLLKHIKGESVSESVNPDIIAILKENVDQFLNERKDKD